MALVWFEYIWKPISYTFTTLTSLMDERCFAKLRMTASDDPFFVYLIQSIWRASNCVELSDPSQASILIEERLKIFFTTSVSSLSTVIMPMTSGIAPFCWEGASSSSSSSLRVRLTRMPYIVMVWKPCKTKNKSGQSIIQFNKFKKQIQRNNPYIKKR